MLVVRKIDIKSVSSLDENGQKRNKMHGFNAYVKELEHYAIAALAGKDELLSQLDLREILNEGAAVQLRKAMPLKDRQEIGAFFTGDLLRKVALKSVFHEKSVGKIVDPACGAGDLLIECSNALPVLEDIGETVTYWGGCLHGRDINEQFVRAAKARLVLTAFSRGARKLQEPILELRDSFPGIKRGDAMNGEVDFQNSDVVLNPPFVTVSADSGCEWGKGGVSAAAVFLDRWLSSLGPKRKIVAILPDVLRSGARYEQWRCMVEREAQIKKIEVYGAFDPQADVDVFVLELIKKASQKENKNKEKKVRWVAAKADGETTVGERFVVSVGPFVPHRHGHAGDQYPFLNSKNALPWEVVKIPVDSVLFSGTVHMAPFVVIRRTSSPSDKIRAIGSIVVGVGPVVVENHLIVCKPLSGSLAECRELIDVLKNQKTTDWLNSRIRCRHLTVGSVREMPMCG